MRPVSHVGKRFGRLVALEKVQKHRKVNGTYYRCRCDCGNETVALYSNLQNGNTQSCGCFRREVNHRRKQDDATIRLNEIWRYYRRNAIVRRVDWSLPKELFKSLVQSPCKYCGHCEQFGGIDRADNDKGYTPENSVPCCRWCNWGKNERTVEEFRQWVRNLYERLVLY